MRLLPHVLIGVLFVLAGCKRISVTEADHEQTVSQIRGGSEEQYPQGRLSTLRLQSPDGEIIVAVTFPKPIDESWHPGFGFSGNGNDNTQWEDVDKVRFLGDEDAEPLIIHWEYSTRTGKLKFANKQFDLPQGKLAVLGYDNQMNPYCEFRDHTPENVEQLRKELGADTLPKKVLPSLPEPAPPATNRTSPSNP